MSRSNQCDVFGFPLPQRHSPGSPSPSSRVHPEHRTAPVRRRNIWQDCRGDEIEVHDSTANSVVVLTGCQETLVVTTPIRTDSVAVGDSILVTCKVTATECDGSTRPAAGDSVNVRVTAGSGTITSPGTGLSGGTGALLRTAADGTASIIWILGSTASLQSLQVAASNTEVLGLDLNVNTDVSPKPSLRLIGVSGGLGSN